MQTVINGLAQGSIIAIAAVAITLIFRISRFANASFGDLMTVGAYITLGVASVSGVSLIWAAIIGVVCTAIFGGGLYLLVFRRLEGRTFTLFAASIGCALMMRSVVQYAAGTQTRVYGTGSESALVIAGIRVASSAMITFAVCASVGILLYFLFKRTLMGRRIRAVADDSVLAQVTGIEVSRTTLGVWILASGLAGVAGVLVAVVGALSPEMGWNFLLGAFAAAILGGLGNTSGAIVGGLVVGLAQQSAILVLPAAYKPAVGFVLMILVLVIRPTGIFAAKVRV